MNDLSFIGFEATDENFQLMADVINEHHGHRHPRTVEELKFYDTLDDGRYFRERYIIQQNGENIGVMMLFQSEWSFHPQKYRFRFDVFKAHLNADVLQQIWRFIQARLADKDLITYCTEFDEYQPYYINFFEDIGFKAVMRYPASELVLADFDFAKFADVEANVKASGIEIISAEELSRRNAEWVRLLWALEVELDQDVPSPDETMTLTYDSYLKRVESNPRWDMSIFFVAMDGDQLVGMSRAILPQPNTKRYGTGMTGVVRSHRRRGIATAMKVAALRQVLADGGEVIETDNEENNPMYQINMQLGFKPIEALVDYELSVSQDPK